MEKQNPFGDTLTVMMNPMKKNVQGESTMKTPWQVLDELRGESSDDGENDVGGGSGNHRRGKNGVGGGSGGENGNGGDVSGGGGVPPVAVVESGGVREGVMGKKRKTSVVRDPPTGKPTCALCLKEFPTWKGAFGHMRAHPDRDYRGFFKPPVFGSTSSTQHHHPLKKGNTSESKKISFFFFMRLQQQCLNDFDVVLKWQVVMVKARVLVERKGQHRCLFKC